MRIYIDENVKSLCVEHNGVVLNFLKPVTRLNRAQWSPDNFKEANDVITHMTDTDRERLWGCYQRAYDIIVESDEFDMAAFKHVVLEAANELITVKLCDDYVSNQMKVVYPPSCHESYKDVKDVMYREATYIRSEFDELIGTIIGWKLLMPFISVFRAYRTEGAGVTQVTADLEVLLLLSGSRWLASAGWVRFVEYIQSNLDNHFSEDEAKGLTLRMTIEASDISEPDFPALLSIAIFNRKLAVSPIVMSEEKHLISQVFYNIKSVIPSLVDELSVVRKRIEDSDYGDEDDKRDYFFRYTSQIWIPDDVLVMSTVYSEQLERVLKDMNAKLPDDKQIELRLVERCLAALERHRPSENQTALTLTGWILHDLVNARVIESLDSTRLHMSQEKFEAAQCLPDKTPHQRRLRAEAIDGAVYSAVDRARARLNLMAIAQAFLITYNLSNLAALMSTYELTKTTFGLSEVQTATEAQLLPVTVEWAEELKLRYSNFKPRSGAKLRRNSTNVIGYWCVQVFARGICDIPLVLKTSSIMASTLGSKNGEFAVSPNIRNEVAELLCIMSDI